MKIENYKKFYISGLGKKNFYVIPNNCFTKPELKKEKEKLRRMHTQWNKKVFFRIKRITTDWGENRFLLYMYSTEHNFMQGFRNNRYGKKKKRGK
ncbi:MAG: hypothetical protein ABIB46_06270 [bacterium]